MNLARRITGPAKSIVINGVVREQLTSPRILENIGMEKIVMLLVNCCRLSPQTFLPGLKPQKEDYSSCDSMVHLIALDSLLGTGTNR
jgi:hypothetical protein